MALTDEEKRLLAQLEASLAADDPKLASLMRGHGRHQVPLQRILLSGAGFVVGVTLLVEGIQTYPWLSVVGFLVMLTSAVIALGAWRAPGQRRSSTRSRVGQRQSMNTRRNPHHAGDNGSAFITKIEDRWRRRRENP